MGEWVLDYSEVDGLVIEVPIRHPTLPVNTWVHVSGIATDWLSFPPALTDGDWHRSVSPVIASVSAGDTALAGQASVSIASAKRSGNGFLNTDDWGMAFDSVGKFPGRVDGPSEFSFQMPWATLGNCYPVGAAVTVDLLILRPSLIPDTPAPYGQNPKPSAIAKLESDRARLVFDLQKATRDVRELSLRLTEFEERAEQLAQLLQSPSPAPGPPRRMPIRISIGPGIPVAPPSVPRDTYTPPQETERQSPKPKKREHNPPK